MTDESKNASVGDAIPSLPTDSEGAYKWMMSRRLPSTQAISWYRGFGPNGLYSFQLPSPVTANHMAFENGRSVRRIVKTCHDDPEIKDLRARAIASYRNDATGDYIDVAFADYAAAVIRLAYNVTDAEMEVLLFSGAQWHDGMIAHLCGGTFGQNPKTDAKDVIAALRAARSESASENSMPEAWPAPRRSFRDVLKRLTPWRK